MRVCVCVRIMRSVSGGSSPLQSHTFRFVLSYAQRECESYTHTERERERERERESGRGVFVPVLGQYELVSRET